MDNTIFIPTRGIRFIHTPTHRIEVVWGDAPLRVKRVSLYRYKIPVRGPFWLQRMIRFLNGDGEFVGDRHVDPENVGGIQRWLRNKGVASSAIAACLRTISHYKLWSEDSERAYETLSVLEIAIFLKKGQDIEYRPFSLTHPSMGYGTFYAPEDIERLRQEIRGFQPLAVIDYDPEKGFVIHLA